jgi:hypothetical protein
MIAVFLYIKIRFGLKRIECVRSEVLTLNK